MQSGVVPGGKIFDIWFWFTAVPVGMAVFVIDLSLEKPGVMIDMKAFQEMALSFQHTEQVPHFERVGFKIIGKRMFTTYLEKNNTANIFLTPAEQKLFCKMDKTNIYPVPNKWGEKGATTFELNAAATEVVMEALLSAYNEIIKPKTKK